MSPEMSDISVARQMGRLEGKVEELDKRMTRREAEDTEWRDDMKSRMLETTTTLSEINNKLSQSVGVISAMKWIVGFLGACCVPAAGWLLTHPWPFGK